MLKEWNSCHTVWRETLEGTNLDEMARKRYWRNKLWLIDDKSLIKHILKQFEDTSAPNLSIPKRVCAYL